MAARRHAALHGLGLRDVDNRVEQVCLAMLATKILAG